ncbi:uncharacterized protein Z519_04239 [Cladophialophora bantiana CBS 173.52]|uniref:Amidohydrolase-related domain-containing protein n=1 Tax=Cladophialophora bantiana (strain ATCC 10958 / CBS 173.52 / CDC B-1940 / NIH 8579) TaxID=1442370 RepID=A0A0D2IFW0_CLAB1|nr:uncharacterized protein Z519_04239 [Cladophialophora bantiana CBS 173.52]KIW95654.1 hypothetical protein Z519_04239 [Cladophialophora bantiana CBS 173.52]
MSSTAIMNVQVFDGETIHPDTTVVVSGPTITSVGGNVPEGAVVIDGKGCTLLPGLIDSHVHTGVPQLGLALRFGVTTELEMMGHWTIGQRREISERDDLADLRSASYGLTPPDGHPNQLTKNLDLSAAFPHHSDSSPGDPLLINARTTDEAIAFVRQRVKEGADYIKIMIEEGSVFRSPGLPTLPQETILAAVEEAHNYNKLAIAHALTYDAAEEAARVGIDGLSHLFVDRGADSTIIEKLTGMFITPCLCLNASILGKKPTDLAADPRVSAKLPPVWLTHLEGSMGTFPDGDFDIVLKSVADLHKAGIDILVGTDSSFPVPHLAGIAHGASVHHELQLLVQSGFTPTEALRAATSVPARCFGLKDRGRIQEGLRADLLLVEGDPTSDIRSTLFIRSVWRRGALLHSTL